PPGNFKLDLETGGDQQRNCGKPVGKKMSQPGERFASVPPPNAKMQDLTPRCKSRRERIQRRFPSVLTDLTIPTIR
ncbi:MAG: hypothetical protein MUP27_07285, partial [Desulfobacterales bacterium]|nr:hypothetical protein [Desulfobacterales bacterium]